jgi:hypothetical protein
VTSFLNQKFASSSIRGRTWLNDCTVYSRDLAATRSSSDAKGCSAQGPVILSDGPFSHRGVPRASSCRIGERIPAERRGDRFCAPGSDCSPVLARGPAQRRVRYALLMKLVK